MKSVVITGGSTGLGKACAPKDLSGALDADEAAKIVEYMVNLPDSVTIPELGIKPFSS